MSGSSATATRQREKIRLEPVTPELLAEVVRRIVAAIAPEKIILFGSYAYGTPHEYSDLDLFVIKAGADDYLDVEGQVDGLFWDLLLPMDILVRTPEQVNEEVALGNSFIRNAVLGKGRVLYERHPGEL